MIFPEEISASFPLKGDVFLKMLSGHFNYFSSFSILHEYPDFQVLNKCQTACQ